MRKQTGPTEPSNVFTAIEAGLAEIGELGFPAKLLAVVSALLPGERQQAVCYSTTDQRPSLLADTNIAASACDLYLQSYVDYDPFLACWRSQRRSGVVTLDQALSMSPRSEVFRSQFMRRVGYVDEIAVIVPCTPSDCIAFFVERCERRFVEHEVARLQEAYPIIRGLSLAHSRAQGRGSRSNDKTPLGAQAIRSVCQVRLTDRECDIVSMTLEGFPPLAIARRLELSFGTVRNYRSRIYAKLDITSERELHALFRR